MQIRAMMIAKIDHPINPEFHLWHGNVKNDSPIYEKMKFSARKFNSPKKSFVPFFDSSESDGYLCREGVTISPTCRRGLTPYTF